MTDKRKTELTKQQEIFAEEVAKGNTYTDAYFIAYPKSKEWLRTSVWCEASKLADKEKIQKRINELKEETENDVKWTRQKVLSNINYIINENKQSIERKKQIYQDMINDKYEELLQWANILNTPNIDTKGVNKKISKITKEIRELELQKEVNNSHTKLIQSALQIINRMQGYDITKVEIQETNEERENMKALTKEELKAIAYSKIKKEE